MKNLKTAIIDIGSNTIRLVLYSYNKNEGLREFGNIKTVARLRTYLLPNGEMSEEGIQLLADTLNSFRLILADYEVTDVKAAATAAVRQAVNNGEIIRRMQEETGIKIDILSEEEEAYYGFVAVAHSMDTPSAVTIDIGGGSTEITLFINKKLQKTISFPFGTVSLKQMFIKGTIINNDERIKLRAYVTEQFSSLPWIKDVAFPVIGIGGSARNIAQVHQQKTNYPLSGVHEYSMKRDDLDALQDYLSRFSFEQLKQLDGLSSDRADTIVLALEVFLALLSVVGTNTFQVSKKGLREGVIIGRVLQGNSKAYNKYNVFEESARQLAQAYGRTEEEVHTLAELTGQFYRGCCNLQLFHYNDADLELLIKGAKVYAIGEYIELDSSSQHTFYLISNQSLSGLSHVDRVKLALLASYKNRDYFERFAQPFESWMSKEELKKLRDFGAILKFVYALNMTKRNVVKQLVIKNKGNDLLIEVMTSERAIAEMAQVEKQKKHIERVFKKNITIVFNVEGWNC
ncbi:Ppx/GppA family phosphatase [Solibacillus sp. MA9]|uniref:Ppx/GppA family phosphatase n=1 Tax=Solibacillus palustris TaxID=2908203 RepID=A0ABS9U8W2_9BACL|nr:Ppx/GppA family phosphatase [Solibacillus sp. MA9]MCH7320757.1 Ppx/GppA family phosphatase [Solibacillus sp. MA9]